MVASSSLARLLLLLLFPALVLTACSGSRNTTDSVPDPIDVTPVVTYDMSDYETFDPSDYPDDPPAPVDLRHQVPEQLMENRAGAGISQTLQGFRVQIVNTQDKEEAIVVEERARSWWRNLPGNQRPSNLSNLGVYNVYRQPYYRIRLGDFATRAEAEAAREFIQRRFPNAFIIPDMVTVVR